MATAVRKPKVKVAPERRATKKIWNISDWPSKPERPAQTVMVMGVSVPPGGSVEVPETRLVRAHKLGRDVESGLLHVGEKPPAGYSAWKSSSPRGSVPKTAVRTHGRGAPRPHAQETAPPAVEQVVVAVEDEVEVRREEGHRGRGGRK